MTSLVVEINHGLCNLPVPCYARTNTCRWHEKQQILRRNPSLVTPWALVEEKTTVFRFIDLTRPAISDLEMDKMRKDIHKEKTHLSSITQNKWSLKDYLAQSLTMCVLCSGSFSFYCSKGRDIRRRFLPCQYKVSLTGELRLSGLRIN